MVQVASIQQSQGCEPQHIHGKYTFFRQTVCSPMKEIPTHLKGLQTLSISLTTVDLWIRKLGIVKMAIFLKQIFRF